MRQAANVTAAAALESSPGLGGMPGSTADVGGGGRAAAGCHGRSLCRAADLWPPRALRLRLPVPCVARDLLSAAEVGADPAAGGSTAAGIEVCWWGPSAHNGPCCGGGGGGTAADPRPAAARGQGWPGETARSGPSGGPDRGGGGGCQSLTALISCDLARGRSYSHLVARSSSRKVGPRCPKSDIFVPATLPESARREQRRRAQNPDKLAIGLTGDNHRSVYHESP